MCVRRGFLTASIVVMALAVAPRPASADWTITPFVGWNFGGSADVNTGNSGGSISNKFERQIDYGVSLAGQGNGPVGFEIDFGYSPNFFGVIKDGTGFQFASDSNVTTLMGNLLIGAHGGAVRPYVIGGVGLIRTNVTDLNGLFSPRSKNDFGMDVGGGVMGFFTNNVGVRGDVRYFRGFRGTADNAAGITVSDFKFWRGSLGVSFKF